MKSPFIVMVALAAFASAMTGYITGWRIVGVGYFVASVLAIAGFARHGGDQQ